jgi:multimeric flavodoxin WrbA
MAIKSLIRDDTRHFLGGLFMKILAIVGSPRTNGNTSFLTDRALEEAALQGCEVEKLLLCKHKINPCLGHDMCGTYAKCKIDDDIPMILEKFRNADGVILATPVYYYNMSAQMKMFIDRNYFLYTHNTPLKVKCMGLIVVGEAEGMIPTVNLLKKSFGPGSGNKIENWLTVTGLAFKVGDVRKNQALIEKAHRLGKQMAKRLNI